MNFVTFNPFKTIGIPHTRYIKPENMLAEESVIRGANWLLFPEYWQVNSLVYGWQKRIFPSISTYHLGHDKVEMTRFFQAVVPENTPYTIIKGNYPGVKKEILNEFSYPFIAKKVRSSEGNGVYLINNEAELDKYLAENSILYIQEYLPLDRDLRVVIVGDKIFSAYWRIGKSGDFRNNLAQGGEISYQNIPAPALELVERVARKAGINHAGFDVAYAGGNYYLLEFNVFFGNRGLSGKTQELANHIYRYLIEQSGPGSTGDPLNTKDKIVI